MQIEFSVWGTAKKIQVTAEISLCPACPDTGTSGNDIIESVRVWRGNRSRKLNARKISPRIENAIWKKFDQEVKAANEE